MKRVQLAFAAVGACLVLHGSVAAADVQQAPEGEPDSPKVAALLQQAERIESKPDLDEVQRDRIASQYRDAAEAVRRTESYAKKTEHVSRVAADAPAELEAARAELSTPSTTPERPLTDIADVDALLTEIAILEARDEEARKRLGLLEGERSHRAERRQSLPREASEAKLAADKAREELAALQGDTESDLAMRALLDARREEMEAKSTLHEAELRSYDARRELLATKRDLAALHTRRADALLAEARAQLSELRREQAAAASEEATEAKERAGQVAPELRKLARDVADLAAERAGKSGVTRALSRSEAQLAHVAGQVPELRERFDRIRSKASVLGYTDAIGALLRKERQSLPKSDFLANRRRDQEIASAQSRLLELEELRRDLGDPEGERTTFLSDAFGTNEPSEELASQASALLASRRERLSALIQDYERYFQTLVELDNAERELAEEAKSYRRYIDEHILWIRNAELLKPRLFAPAVDAALWIANPVRWGYAATATALGVQARPFASLGGLLVILVLMRYRRGLREIVESSSRASVWTSQGAPLAWLGAVAATLALAAPIPIALQVIGFAAGSGADAEGSRLPFALSEALPHVAVVWFTFELINQLCRKGGVAGSLLAWDDTRIQTIRRAASMAVIAVSPLALVALVFEYVGDLAWQNSLGRIAFVAATVTVALFARRTLGALDRSPASEGAAGSLSAFAVGLTTAFPLALAALAASGWYFSALELAKRLPATCWLVIALAVADRLILRWLRSAELKLRRDQLRAQISEARKREEQGVTDALVEQSEAIEDQAPDPAALSAQTRQLVRALIGAIGAVGLFAIWGDVLPAFARLESFELWRVSDATSITIRDVLLAILFFGGGALAARNVPSLLEFAVFQRLPLEPGVRYAARSISRYVIATTGTVLGFQALGLGWSDVQWLVAAMTVGLGFGLQEIFANFVSGIILLFERPIRIGDTVTVGDTTGRVSMIRTRATTITDFDRKELVVPNKEFVTGQLVNWSLSDRVLRLKVPVGIAYGSNVELAERTLLEIAQKDELVLAEPEPYVVFSAFGASSLDLELRVYVESIDTLLKTKHTLHKEIDARFRENDIEISFPQRDLHLRTVDSPLPVRVES